MTKLTITIDARARLLMAVLAASDWPDEEQKQQTHAVHHHAKQTRQFVQPYQAHPAVRGVNQALLNGVTLEELFSVALRCAWPTFEPVEPLPRLLKIEKWARSLASFKNETEIAESFWPQHQDEWQTAVADLTAIFADGKVAAFLTSLNPGARQQTITVMPNLIYPALTAVLASTADTLYLLQPPPKAVGESPPWPYGEDPSWVVANVCRHLSTRLMADRLAAVEKPQREMFRHAAATLCLETALDPSEAQAYLLRIKKEHNLPALPEATERLRQYLAGHLAHLTDIFVES